MNCFIASSSCFLPLLYSIHTTVNSMYYFVDKRGVLGCVAFSSVVYYWLCLVITSWAIDAVIRPSRCCFQLSMQPWPLVSSSISFCATCICLYSIHSCVRSSVGLSPLLFRERKSIAVSFKVGGSSAVTDAFNEYRTQAFALLALMFWYK